MGNVSESMNSLIAFVWLILFLLLLVVAVGRSVGLLLTQSSHLLSVINILRRVMPYIRRLWFRFLLRLRFIILTNATGREKKILHKFNQSNTNRPTATWPKQSKIIRWIWMKYEWHQRTQQRTTKFRKKYEHKLYFDDDVKQYRKKNLLSIRLHRFVWWRRNLGRAIKNHNWIHSMI